MKLPLATYTAENGLAWFYDKSAIDFAELDRCRRLLGPLPDFDAGDGGYEGTAAVGGRVYVIRCVSVPEWDFMGRSATYLTVTWLPRKDVLTIDIDKVLTSRAFVEPVHEHRYSFDIECMAPAAADTWSKFIQKLPDMRLTILARREIGQKDIVITLKDREGGNEMTEAEKFFGGKGQSVTCNTPVTMGEPPICPKPPHTVEVPQFSTGARVLGVTLFIVLILLGTYLAKMAGHLLLGYIVGVAAFGILRVLWRIRS